MDLNRANRIARSLMDEQGLTFWDIAWDRKKSVAGSCNHQWSTLTFSRHVTGLATEDEFLDTVRHEMAHALVGPGHGHDEVWQKMASELGCTPSATYSPQNRKKNWRAYCRLGHGFERYRRPKNEAHVSCPRCEKADIFSVILYSSWKAI